MASKSPNLFRDETLGTMKRDPVNGRLVSRITWKEQRVRLAMRAPEEIDEKVIDTLRAHVQRILGAEAKMRMEAAKKLLDTYNEGWNSGKPLTASQIAAKLHVNDLILNDKGAATILCKTDRLFGRCRVMVLLNSKGKVTGAQPVA
jgi:hypothetical protein